MKTIKPRVSFETVTPEMAAEFLQRNKSNRPFRQSWADEWAGRIRRGEWLPTHQGIAFDEDGNLIDGQHRLTGIVIAGIPMYCQITTGLPREAFAVMDQGNRRTLSDISGDSAACVASINLLWRIVEGKSLKRQEAPSPQQYEDAAVWARPLVHRALDAAKGYRSAAGSSGTVVAAVARLMNGQNVLPQLHALAQLQFDEMNLTVQAFYKQITAMQANNKRVPAVEALCRAFRAFDPRATTLKKVQITDMDGDIEVIRAIVMDYADLTRAFETQPIRLVG